MACRFLCEAVQRDTWRWNERQGWGGRENHGTSKENELMNYVRQLHRDLTRQAGEREENDVDP